MKEVRTRFAPSPTGYMHIGNLRTALYEYLVAKKHNGKFILRIEDTDQERYVEGAIEVIYNTLKTVGMDYDEGPDIGGDYGPYIQSERRDIYKEYAQKLVELGGAYYCFCTKERLDALKETGGTYKYDGHCKSLSKDEVLKRLENGEKYVIRQVVPQTGTTSFHDEVYGTITVENDQLDEGILLKSDGLPTYNFANVVDDHLMEITHVVRGSEYLASTPKYNLIYKAFGWELPTYIHLPPIMKTATKKLSKREGDASFEDFYSKGYLKEAIINYIALLGWSPGTDEEIFSLDELKERFSISGLSKSPAIFDNEKLRWMNGIYIRKLSLEEFHKMALPYYRKAVSNPDMDFMTLSRLMHARTEVFSEIPDSLDFFNELSDYDLEMYVHKKMKTNRENSLEYLKEAYSVLETLKDWDEQHIHDALFALVERLGVKNGQVLWPVRTAVSGKQSTPGGAVELAYLMGKDETLRRMAIGIERLS